MSKFQEVFEANKGLSEDEAVLAIYNEADGDLTVKEAQAEYYSMATEAGIILSPTAKKAKWAEATTDLDMSDENDVAQAKSIGEELEIGSTTVIKYVRAKAKAGGVEVSLPPTASRGESKSGKLVDWFTDNLDATRDEIIKAAMDVGLSETSAKYYVNVFNLVNSIRSKIAA